MGTASDIVRVAQGEVGYKEKASCSNLESKDANYGRLNHTKYGKYYNICGSYYCAAFVSWCSAMSNNTDAVAEFTYCPTFVAWFYNRGEYKNRDSGYIPVEGDIIFFNDLKDTKLMDTFDNACHVGIVTEYTNDGYVHTIEGNAVGDEGYDGVFTHKYNLNSKYILGYGHPDYDAADTAQDDREPFNIASGVRVFTNNNISRPVYQTSYMQNKIGSINANEIAYCAGRIGNAYMIYYHVDSGDPDDWEYKVGFVNGFDGGTGF